MYEISSKLCTELSVNLGNSICLNFLDCRAEMCIHLYEEFLCQYEFQLSFSFSRQHEELETKSRRFVYFNFIFNIPSNCVVLDRINIWSSNDLCSFRFFLMAFTYTFFTCKGEKNEKLKKSISQETKGRMKYRRGTRGGEREEVFPALFQKLEKVP